MRQLNQFTQSYAIRTGERPPFMGESGCCDVALIQARKAEPRNAASSPPIYEDDMITDYLILLSISMVVSVIVLWWMKL